MNRIQKICLDQEMAGKGKSVQKDAQPKAHR